MFSGKRPKRSSKCTIASGFSCYPMHGTQRVPESSRRLASAQSQPPAQGCHTRLDIPRPDDSARSDDHDRRIVINARTDVFLRGVGEKMDRFDHAVRRLNAYRKAGADCLYPMGLFDAATIGRLAAAIDGPINVMGLPGTPPVAELERLGIARVSTASGPARVAMTTTKKMAVELARSGNFDIFGGDTIGHPEANALMAKRRE
jgi:hypothetical protein